MSESSDALGLTQWIVGIAMAAFGGLMGAALFVTGTRNRLDEHARRIDAMEREGRAIRATIEDNSRRLETKLDANQIAMMTALLGLNRRASAED